LHGDSRGGAGVGLGRARLRQGRREYELLWIGNQAKIIVDVGVMCAEQGACVRRRSWAGYTIDMFEFEFPTGPWGSGVLRMHNSTKLTSNLVS
jgi:hypothetical protein